MFDRIYILLRISITCSWTFFHCLLKPSSFPPPSLVGWRNWKQYYISFHIANTFVSTHWNERLPCCILSMFPSLDCHHHIGLLMHKSMYVSEQVSIAAPASLDPGWHSTWRLAPTLQSQPRATDLRGGHWPGGAGPSCSGPVHSCHSRVPTCSSVSSVTWPDMASLCTRHMYSSCWMLSADWQRSWWRAVPTSTPPAASCGP